MTPHPTSVKAARAIDDYEPFLRYMDYAANADCDAAQERVNAEVAALIEESCHVSEMVEALREVLHAVDTTQLSHEDAYSLLKRGELWNPVRELLAKVSHER